MSREKNVNRKRAAWSAAILLLAGMCLSVSVYAAQRFWAHREERFVPSYAELTLTEKTDYETIFRQTGLGQTAADKLLQEDGIAGLQRAQELFFHPPEEACRSLFGWFTREDRLVSNGVQLVDLQPGDILLTLSTHSAGWRHGHAGLVIDKDTVLECGLLGTDSSLKSAESWSCYTNYAVLRVKGITQQQQERMKQYALSTLYKVPYRLLAGFSGVKAPKSDEPGFGLQCAYLVWYAWNHFGYDLDADGGRLVTANDLLDADHVEVVQIYGMNPEDFLEEEK